jgi:hypothetical protein
MTKKRDDRTGGDQNDRSARNGCDQGRRQGGGDQAAALAAASTDMVRGLTHAAASDLSPEAIGSILAHLGAAVGEMPALLERLDTSLARHVHGGELVVTGAEYSDEAAAAVSAADRARDSLDLAASAVGFVAECLADAREAIALVTSTGISGRPECPQDPGSTGTTPSSAW